MDNEPLVDAVGRVMRDRFAAMDRAIERCRIARVEQVSAKSALLVFADGSSLALEIPEGARGAQGDHGQPGARGERGADGADGARGERGERGEVGPEGVGIEFVEQDHGAKSFTLRLTNGATVDVDLPQGPQGERGTNGERGEHGERGDIGPEGVGVATVEQAVDGAQSFTLRFTNGTAVEVDLPQGPQGARGEAGEAGVDRFISAPRCVRDGERVDKNDLIRWGGGIVQAIRATTRTPDADPSSYMCIVAGIESFAMVENIETRTFDLTARLTDGTEHTCRARAMPRFMGDGPRPGERIIKGDQFVRGDWLYTASQDGADPANTESGWRRQFLRGKRGEDGERGAQGEPGVGIADITLDGEGILTVRLTNGEEKVVAARGVVGLAA